MSAACMVSAGAFQLFLMIGKRHKTAARTQQDMAEMEAEPGCRNYTRTG